MGELLALSGADLEALGIIKLNPETVIDQTIPGGEPFVVGKDGAYGRIVGKTEDGDRIVAILENPGVWVVPSSGILFLS